ncbi:hypothetical protein JXB31_02455 [Candidatus Woesearchaeota archaeon]|nr:hypothetical protein [Candidatus Woesearchaeota archaeon]
MISLIWPGQNKNKALNSRCGLRWNKRADGPNWVLVSLALALILVIMWSLGVGGMLGRLGLQVAEAACKPLSKIQAFDKACDKVREASPGGDLSRAEQQRIDEYIEGFDGFNKALRDDAKYTKASVTIEQMHIIADINHAECIQEMTTSEGKSYIFKSIVSSGTPIYLLISDKPPMGINVLKLTVPKDDMTEYSLENLPNEDNSGVETKQLLRVEGITSDNRVKVLNEEYCKEQVGWFNPSHRWIWGDCKEPVSFNLRKVFLNRPCSTDAAKADVP